MECLSCKSEMIFWGDAFTSYICKLCNKSHMYHMTCVPDICPACSEENHVCERCWKKLNKEEFFSEIYENNSQKSLLIFRVWDKNKKIMINQPKDFIIDSSWHLFNMKVPLSSGYTMMLFAQSVDKNWKLIFVWDIVKNNNMEYLVIMDKFLWFQLVSEKWTIWLWTVNSKEFEIIWNIYEKQKEA